VFTRRDRGTRPGPGGRLKREHPVVGDRIATVEAIRVRAPEWERTDEWSTSPLDALFDTGAAMRGQAVGLFNGPVASRTDPVLYVIVEVRTEQGLVGHGAVGLGSEAVARAVEHLLAPLVIGHSPFDVELLWETMYRSTVNVGRRGLMLEAISGIDIALWDVMGHATGQPVYNLLGGRTRRRLRAYGSRLYAREDRERLREEALELTAAGFTAVKMRFGYGPADGPRGMRENEALVRIVREAIGADVELMADAYMGWNGDYAAAMIRRLEPYDLRWVEEPLMPDDVTGYARLRRRLRTPIACGEHEFTRWGFRELIVNDAVDVLQPDVNRVGGITEARKIWALASAHHLEVVPHSGNAHNLHLAIAHLNTPIVECFPRHVRDADTFLAELFIGEPAPAGGHIELSDRPGLGYELNHALLDELRLGPGA
jgi:L-alanine-DL-glutamate epimerase-like enolase superfamily enzyme